VNEEFGSLGDVRFSLLTDVVELSSQGYTKFPLLSLDLINRKDVRDMNAAGDKSLGLLRICANSAELEDDVLDQELPPWNDALLIHPDALCDLDNQTSVLLCKLQIIQLVLEPLFIFSLTTANEFPDFNFDLLAFPIKVLDVLADPFLNPLKEQILGLICVKDFVCGLGYFQLRLIS